MNLESDNSEWPQLRNPPVVEALLDIRVNLSREVGLDQLAVLQATVKEEYPSCREHFSWRGNFKLDSDGTLEAIREAGVPDGYHFLSRDGRQLFQARLDGYTFNRLRPYQSWRSMVNQARRHWEGYCEATSPLEVTRLALRFINRIPIPVSLGDFKEYVLTAPEIAPALPQGLAGFLLRLIVPMGEFGCVATITETMEQPREGLIPLILDIDVYREAQLRPDSPEIWATFDQLRKAKNQVFFRTITEKAKELFL